LTSPRSAKWVKDDGGYTGILLGQVRWVDPNSISGKETPDMPQLSPERRAEVVETVQQIRQRAVVGIDPYSKTEQKTLNVLIDFVRAGHPIGCSRSAGEYLQWAIVLLCQSMWKT